MATALALQSAGLDVRVFEQREEFRPAGVAIFIWPHGLNALKSIDAATCDRVVSSGAVISNIAIEQLHAIVPVARRSSVLALQDGRITHRRRC